MKMDSTYGVLLVAVLVSTVWCDNKYQKTNANLRTIPTDIPEDTTEVNLRSNGLRTVPTDSFKKLKRCEKMNLNNNSISTVEDGAFNGLDKLEELHLSTNKLTDIRKEMWQGLKSLKRLYMSSNQISSLGDGAFSTLPRLEVLNINSNSLPNVKPAMFEGMNSIKTLSLSNNNIRTVEPKTFYKLPQVLKSLQLGHNDIHTLPPNMLNRARHPTKLKLDIGYNPVECDTNVCWLVKAKADSWAWDYDMTSVVKDCEYVESYDEKCPEDNPVDESSAGHLTCSGWMAIAMYVILSNVFQ